VFHDEEYVLYIFCLSTFHDEEYVLYICVFTYLVLFSFVSSITYLVFFEYVSR
jgi:hypothetical protein